MEDLMKQHDSLSKSGTLEKAVKDADKLVDFLQSAYDGVTQDPNAGGMAVAKIKKPTKEIIDKFEDDLKVVNKGLNRYDKEIKAKFKEIKLPTAANDPIAERPSLINRALAMHLLREGRFDVAKAFVREVNEGPQHHDHASEEDEDEAIMMHPEDAKKEQPASENSWQRDFENVNSMEDVESHSDDLSSTSSKLQAKFAEMYHILDSLRNNHDPDPAIAWSRQHSNELELRGSNLEFELSRLKFVDLYTSPPSANDTMSDEIPDPPIATPTMRALEYARATFPAFSTRYGPEIRSLMGSLAFAPALQTSPYTTLFHLQASYNAASEAFMREFCGMLGLSSASPLYTAVTAGGIALPVLEKVERVMAASRGQWTSVNELPVETPLPGSFSFHSVFVCPVSKEQATDANPPMMMPCGHVIAKESLEAHSRGKSRMKCPYCPSESRAGDAKRVYI
ncbi:hypothetical protein MBLNU230_g5447t1 [Neophaeotheca triangularis]